MAGPAGKTGHIHSVQPTHSLKLKLQPLMFKDIPSNQTPTQGQLWPRGTKS